MTYNCPNCNEIMNAPIDNICECPSCSTMLYERALQGIEDLRQQLEAANAANDKLVNESLELESKLVSAQKLIAELEAENIHNQTWIMLDGHLSQIQTVNWEEMTVELQNTDGRTRRKLVLI